LKQLVLAITGASGAAYARRLARSIVAAGHHLHLVVSPHGRQLLADELGLPTADPAALIGKDTDRVTLYAHRDLAARISSGSFRTDGMAICPCSSNSLNAIAAGLGENLVHRAAHVTLKEGRRLVLVYREMPASQIDLNNMLRLSRAGAIICPACPGFYLQPRSVDDLVDFVVGKVLDLLDVEHQLNTRWTGRDSRSAPASDPEV